MAKEQKIKIKKEATLVIIKPDGIQKSLTGNVITRLSRGRLIILGAKMVSVSKKLAEDHYRQLQDKPFFSDLIKYLMGDYHTNRVMALVYYGGNAIEKVRKLCGSTNPEEAEPVSIRGAYGRITTRGVYENVIHASSNAEDAEREIKLWFEPDDIVLHKLYPTKDAIIKTHKQKTWA